MPAIKNPVRVTAYIEPNEQIMTVTGPMSGEEWCKAEARRLNNDGIPAKAITRIVEIRRKVKAKPELDANGKPVPLPEGEEAPTVEVVSRSRKSYIVRAGAGCMDLRPDDDTDEEQEG